MKSIPSASNTSTEKKLLTTIEVAKELNICQRSVDNLRASQSLAYVRIGRAVRFDPSDVQAFKNSRRVCAA